MKDHVPRRSAGPNFRPWLSIRLKSDQGRAGTSSVPVMSCGGRSEWREDNRMPAAAAMHSRAMDSIFEREVMTRLSHRAKSAVESVGAMIESCARELRAAKVYFGHGTDNARDEAAELVFFVAGLDHERGAAAYPQVLTARQAARIGLLLKRRIRERVPLAYLTHRAFFAGLELYVDARVLVPRSPIAELILSRFEPWIAARRVRRILDIGTGSGAIALACAHVFKTARVDAVDISAPALQVCRRNARRLGLAKRVTTLRSDYFSAGPPRRYDI